MPATDNLMAGLAGFAQGFGDVYKMNLKKDLEDVPIEQVEALTGKSFPQIARGSTIPKEMIPVLVRQENPKTTTVIDRLGGSKSYSGDVRFAPNNDQVPLYIDGEAQLRSNGDQTLVPKGTKNFNTARTPTTKPPAPELTPEALQMQSDLYGQTGTLPNMGMGGANIKTQIMNKKAQDSIAMGQTAKDINENRIANLARTQSAKSVAANAEIEDVKVNLANHLQSLIKDAYDPKKDTYNIPPSMHSDLALGLARMLSSSGQTSVEMEQQLRQKTAKEGLAGALIYLGFDPKEIGGTTDSVAKFFAKTIARQGNTAAKLRDSYGKNTGSGFDSSTTPGMGGNEKPVLPIVPKKGFTSDGGPALSEPGFPKVKNRSADDILNQYLKGK